MRTRTPLYTLTAFGLRNPWFVWSFERGGYDEWCPACRGEGVQVTSPCGNRIDPTRCTRADGCDDCRRTCPACHGSRLRLPDGLHPDDFGDRASYLAAVRMFPGLEVDPTPRIDMRAQL